MTPGIEKVVDSHMDIDHFAILIHCTPQQLLLLALNFHEYVTRQTGLRLTDKSRVALDHAAFLQRPNPAQTGGFGQIHEVRELHITDTPIVLQCLQNRSIISV